MLPAKYTAVLVQVESRRSFFFQNFFFSPWEGHSTSVLSTSSSSLLPRCKLAARRGVMEFREVEVQDRRRRRLRIQIENEDSTAVGRIRVAGRLWCWAREDCWSTKREPLEERGVEFISALRPCSPVEWTPERILACPGGQTAAPTLASAFPGYRAFSSLLLPPTTRPCISRVGGTPMTKVHARYAQPEFCPTLSLFKFSWPHFYFVSLRFSSRKFRTRGFLRIRLKRVVDIIIGYRFFRGILRGCYTLESRR